MYTFKIFSLYISAICFRIFNKFYARKPYKNEIQNWSSRQAVLPNFTTCHNPPFLKILVGFQNNLVILRFKCTLHGKIKDYFDI